MSYSFDELQNANLADNQKSFFELDLNNENDILDWLNRELGNLKASSWTRLESVKNNYLRYKCVQYQQQVYTPRDVLETQKTYQPQIVIPFIRDVVDEKVARLTEYDPYIYPMPTHDETKDKNDAKIAKRFLDHIKYTKDMPSKIRKFIRNSKVGGESYLWITWDPDQGEPVQFVKKMMDQNAPYTEDQPMQETTMQGDVSIKNKTQFFVYRPEKDWEDTDYVFVIEWAETAKLKAEYPAKRDSIQSETQEPFFDFNSLTEQFVTNQCRKIYFYHKKTKFLPEGYEACFVPTALLKKGRLSYEHGLLPIVPLLDCENPDEHRGIPLIEYLRALPAALNNALNATVKAFMLAGNPKWFVQSNSIDEQQLTNDVGIVKVKMGATEPKLMQANPISGQFQQFFGLMKELYYQMSRTNSISRGDLPQGVTANVALQFVSESENRRSAEETRKVQEAIKEAYTLILKTCGQYYKPEDERTMQVVGSDNKYALEDYDVAAIAKPYHLILQNVSGLPESKALRTQFVIDMSNARPGLFPDEQVNEMLGFGQTEKYMDLASIAARAAEDENEMMMNTGQYVEPAEYEDLITHWRIHIQPLQAVGFKLKLPKDNQDMMKSHILATEMLMTEQAKFSPQFLGKLVMLPQFPMFFKDPMLSQMLGMATGMSAQVQALEAAPLQATMTPDQAPIEQGAMQ